MGGVLIDIVAEAHGSCKAIIGFGVNVNMKECDVKEMSQSWTSLEHMLNENLDRNRVSAHIIQSLLEGLELFREKGLAPFLSDWIAHDLLAGKKVSITTGGDLKTGIARGIDDHGYLRLETSSGKVELISCGDATLA